MRAIRPITGSLTLAALATTLFLVACDHDPVGVDAFSAAPCVLPALPASYAGVVVDPADLSAALADAATRSSAGLEPRDHTDELAGALAQLAGQLGRGPSDGNCRLLVLAADALDRQNESAEAPDRMSIEMVLHLTNAVLRAE